MRTNYKIRNRIEGNQRKYDAELEGLATSESVPGDRNKIDEAFDNYVQTNSVCLIAGYEKHEFLTLLITEMLKEIKVDWQQLRSKKVIYKNQKFDLDIWNEEYIAIVCACIHQHAPFSNRIEFISNFVNRTHKQVKSLLAIHYKRYNEWFEDDNYQEIFVNFHTEISLYFNKFYLMDFEYGYKKK